MGGEKRLAIILGWTPTIRRGTVTLRSKGGRGDEEGGAQRKDVGEEAGVREERMGREEGGS